MSTILQFEGIVEYKVVDNMGTFLLVYWRPITLRFSQWVMSFKVLDELENLTPVWKCVEIELFYYVFTQKNLLFRLPRQDFIIFVWIYQNVCPVSWGCRIYRLLLCRVLTPHPNECPGYDTKQSDGEVPVTLELGECGVPLYCHRSQVHSGPAW